MAENTEENVSLTLNDIQNVTQIIDIAFRRGAFTASEASQVGKVYEHLSLFVSQNTPATDESENTEEVEEKPAPTKAKKTTKAKKD